MCVCVCVCVCVFGFKFESKDNNSNVLFCFVKDNLTKNMVASQCVMVVDLGEQTVCYAMAFHYLHQKES